MVSTNYPLTESRALDDDNRRSCGRIKAKLSKTSIGSVLDVSAGGVRVLHKGKPPFKIGDEITLVLRGPKNYCRATVRIAWIKRTGLRWHEIGMQFVGEESDTKRVATSIARYSIAGMESEFASEGFANDR